MEELGFEVYGCDIAEEPIRFAREVYGLRNVIASQVDQLPEDWQDFDVITAFEVLEHTENPLDFLKCLYNLLKPGGYLFLSVPFKTKRKPLRGDYPPIHLTRWPLKALKLAINKAGFLQQETRTFAMPYRNKWQYFLDLILPKSLKKWYAHLQEERQGEMMSSKRGSREKSRQDMLKNLFKLGIKWIGRIGLFPFFGLFYPFASIVLPKTRVLITRKPLRGE
jgi:2-polyprenyl-3-methyl-5-hydroxy-6-metoxy-1,4-benzoquinol methylase